MEAQTVANALKAASPLAIMSGGAFLLLLLEVFLKGNWARGSVTAITLLVALGTSILVSGHFGQNQVVFSGTLYQDPFSWFFMVFLIMGTLLTLLMMVGRLGDQKIEAPSEFYSLLLMSTTGAALFASSAELITLFLALEIMSMALYCLCGSAVTVRGSTESALKYFLLGSFSSAFLLYGIALIYGLTGTTSIPEIAVALQSIGDKPAVAFAIGLTLVGLIFKIGAVPFHFWAPDVYQGAPTSVTAYMSCVIKASAVAVAMRILWVGFGASEGTWSGVIWIVALLTMVVGNVIAVRQRNVKRMLAYSSIAHGGYLAVGFLARADQFGGGSAILFYLVAYTLMTLGAFAVLLLVSSTDPDSPHADDITRFHGLSKTNPGLAAAMAVFLLSLAGIPPGMAGLLGKFYIFSAAIKGEFVGLAIVGVLASAISCYYYLRVIVAMYFTEPGDNTPSKISLALPIRGLITVCVIGVVLFGVFPDRIYTRAMVVMYSFLGA